MYLRKLPSIIIFILALFIILPGCYQEDVWKTANRKTDADVIYNFGDKVVFEGWNGIEYSIVLSREPEAEVNVTVTTDEQLLVAGSGVITFTPSNWNEPQLLTINASDDALDDIDEIDSDFDGIPDLHTGVVTHSVSSTDSYFGQKSDTELMVFIYDNDTAEVSITSTNLSISESGTSGSYQVFLTSEPVDVVEITVEPDSVTTSNALVDQVSLIFTPGDWYVPQTINVNAIDDYIDEINQQDGVITHRVISEDSKYDVLRDIEMAVTIDDDDTAGVSIFRTDLFISESGISDSYEVSLASEPLDDVTIDIGLDSVIMLNASVNPRTLTFTSDNWDAPVTIEIIAFYDDIDEIDDIDQQEGVITHSVTSTDSLYRELSNIELPVFIEDNDTAGVSINKNSLYIQERGTGDSYEVSLTSQPLAEVKIDVLPDIVTTFNASVSETALTFNSDNWNDPQTIYIDASDDYIDEDLQTGAITYSLESTDPKYYELIVSGTSVLIDDDDDTAGVSINRTNLSISESGVSDSYEVVLTSQPLGDVTITVNPDTGIQSDVSVIPNPLTFTSDNWLTSQTVTVSAEVDTNPEGNMLGIIQNDVTSSDAKYEGIFTANVNIIIIDDDLIIISPTSISAVEGDVTGDQYTIELAPTAPDPSDDVVITITPNNLYDQTLVNGTSDAITVIFSSGNRGPEPITVNTTDDELPEENIITDIIIHDVTSDDVRYHQTIVQDVTVDIIDNEICVLASASGSSPDGSPSNPYSTILLGVSAGDSLMSLTDTANVLIAAGTYNESIALANNVSLIGGYDAAFMTRNPETNKAVLNATGQTYAIMGNTTISSETIITGLYINGPASTSSYAIYNVVGDSSPLFIENFIYGGDGPNAYGIYCSAGNPVIMNNIIIGGSNVVSTGIHSQTGAAPVIRNNVIYGGGGSITYGINIADTSNVNVQNNTINGGSGISTAMGIIMASCNLTIQNNIIFNTSTGGSYGIYENDGDATPDYVQNNNIFDCVTALYFDNDAGKNQTAINGNGEFWDGTGDAMTGSGNVFDNNKNIDLFASGGLIDASGDFSTLTAWDDWQLNSNASPDVSQGGLDLSSQFKTDKLKIPRTDPWSIGAYEFD